MNNISIVQKDSPLILLPKHRDIDGVWNRYIYACEIPVNWTGSPPDQWSSADVETARPAEPFRILQMIDPNSGMGWDPKAKQRYQYVRIGSVPLARMLPPESVGDVWRDEPAPRPFCRLDLLSPYILDILDAEAAQ